MKPNVDTIKPYNPIPTIKQFHASMGQIRCIVGPVGSAKSSGGAMEVCYYAPHYLFNTYGIKKTTWCVLRGTYRELMDTTVKTVKDPEEGWFPDGEFHASDNIYVIRYDNGIEVEILFRACDRTSDVKKFKSLALYGYWIDESIEVPTAVKSMLKTRIGRQPRWAVWDKILREKYPELTNLTEEALQAHVADHPETFITRMGIETTNPPDIEHPTYSEFNWTTPPPGPVPKGEPKKNHIGFWQPPRENEANLRPGYYDDLMNDYSDQPDWADMYVDGKPGALVVGKLVYHNFRRALHVAHGDLTWSKGDLWRGWDNSGNCPACVVIQMPTPNHIQVIREFHTDKMGIVDFTEAVKVSCNMLFPDAKYIDWEDPAGENQYSKRDGGFTSNAKLMREECGIDVRPSEQNWSARRESVERQLGRIDGILIDPSCIRLINGFIAGYSYPEIGKTGIHGDKPIKNRFSHVHDALQYVLVKLVGEASRNLDQEAVAKSDFEVI